MLQGCFFCVCLLTPRQQPWVEFIYTGCGIHAVHSISSHSLSTTATGTERRAVRLEDGRGMGRCGQATGVRVDTTFWWKLGEQWASVRRARGSRHRGATGTAGSLLSSLSLGCGTGCGRATCGTLIRFGTWGWGEACLAIDTGVSSIMVVLPVTFIC